MHPPVTLLLPGWCSMKACIWLVANWISSNKGFKDDGRWAKAWSDQCPSDWRPPMLLQLLSALSEIQENASEMSNVVHEVWQVPCLLFTESTLIIKIYSEDDEDLSIGGTIHRTCTVSNRPNEGWSCAWQTPTGRRITRGELTVRSLTQSHVGVYTCTCTRTKGNLVSSKTSRITDLSTFTSAWLRKT